MNTRWYSLQRRLLLMLLAGVALSGIGMLVGAYLATHHEIDELFDAQLAQSAEALLFQRFRHHTNNKPFRQDSRWVEDEDDHREEDEAENDKDISSHEHGKREKHANRPKRDHHPYQTSLVFQIWDEDGILTSRSISAPLPPLIDLATPEGYYDLPGNNGATWRYLKRWDDRHHYQVIVGEDHAVRNEMIRSILLKLSIPALFGFPLLALAAVLLLRRGLQPLDKIASEVAKLSPHDLQPFTLSQAPSEIRPLLESLNALLERVERSLAHERRFTSNAAHELRTPLAALSAQVQVAMNARNDAERDHALNQLATGVKRSGLLVDQLLTLARLEPEGTRLTAQPTRLDQLTESVCADHGEKALEKNIQLELHAEPNATPLMAHADLLRILLRNLLDNALTYTPNGGQIRVEVDDQHIEIHDSGPGIPEADQTRVFEPFTRLAGQEIPGSGLGLAIAQRIAELHGTTIQLQKSPLGGLCARIRF